MLHVRKSVAALGVAVAMTVGALSAASPASAAERNGTCDTNEFCYYFNSNQAGSVSDFTDSVTDYGTNPKSCYVFKGAGNGQGVCVKNHAASVWNRTNKTVRVYFNSNYAGASQDFTAGARGNLNSTLKNNNASHEIGPSSGGGAQTPVDDYDGNARGFKQDNCTAFAAWRIVSRLGVPGFDDYWKTHWGDAGNWDNAAREVGIPVDKTPMVGAIAVNDVHKVGHVAYVNKVYSDGSFDVEEYNWNNQNPPRYGTRSHVHVSDAQADFQYMLHF